MTAKLGTVLMVGGVAVGTIAAVALGLHLKVVLPAEVLTVVVYKGMFAAAAGLLAAGAVVRRRAVMKREAPFSLTSGPRTRGE
jgi:predicted lysophospholipase L1 biosynthesis ABC-type transport system permease subunit